MSNYDGVDGIQPRNDLGGINLTTVPKVFIECANMRNATDAALLVTPSFQQSAACAMAQAITKFLAGRPGVIGVRGGVSGGRASASGARTSVE